VPSPNDNRPLAGLAGLPHDVAMYRAIVGHGDVKPDVALPTVLARQASVVRCLAILRFNEAMRRMGITGRSVLEQHDVGAAQRKAKLHL
jgi:hypothetical protein